MGELTGTTFAGLDVRDAIRSDLVSTVYAAVDPADYDRPLVLRVVAADLCATRGDDRDLYRRFLGRAAAALTFEHLHAPRIEEVGEYHGRGYLVASSVDTVPLGEFIDERGPLDMNAALELFAQVADVLDASHHAGLNHGAVNPTTLRIVPTARGVPPQVNLTGFGIGALLELRLRRDRRRLHSVDELLYVAPEQLRNQPLTARADQYAMACAFVHTVTGSPPFMRNSVGGLFGAHLFVEPTLVPPLADGPIAKALAKDARDRYATCGQLVADLERARRSAENRRRAEVRRRETVAHPWIDEQPSDDDGGAAAASVRAAHDDEVPAASTPAHVGGDDGIAYTADGRRIIALPASSGTEPGATPGLDHAAMANGRSLMATRTGAPSVRDDNSSTNERTGSNMTYPTRGNGSDAQAVQADAQDPGTGTTDDNDVPLLSDVLRTRPQPERSRSWRPTAALVGLFVVVMMLTAVVVWLLLS